MKNRTRKPRTNLPYVAAAVLAVLAVVVGLVGPSTWAKVSGGSGNTSAKDRVEASPPPALFPTASVDATATQVAAQRKQAGVLIRTWVSTHGTRDDDQSFVAWVEKSFPAPPATIAAEMPTVVELAKTRDSAGVKAATWLESFGKKDIWKLYAHDQAEVLSSSRGKDRKDEVKAILKMSKTIADELGTRFGSSAPYVRLPSLRPDHQVTAGQKCPCSYPSRHASAAASSEMVLGTLMPERDGQYVAMESQVDYSRVYMAGHFPADIAAGALLGDLVGDYFLVTRNGIDPSSLRG